MFFSVTKTHISLRVSTSTVFINIRNDVSCCIERCTGKEQYLTLTSLAVLTRVMLPLPILICC